MISEFRKIPCVIQRGGTSKGVFLHEKDLPKDPELRKRVILAILGSPDKRKIDGSERQILCPARVLSSALHFREREVTEMDRYPGMIRNLNTGISLRTASLPKMPMRISESGGVIE